MSSRAGIALAAVLVLSAVSTQAAQKKTPQKSDSKPAAVMPITAPPDVKHLYFHGLDHYGNMHQHGKALDAWRAAVRHDPKCAVCWTMIAYLSFDPKEASRARAQAKRLAPQTSPGEQLFVKWIIGKAENDYLPAIAAMNDLLAMHPGDKWLLFLAGNWLQNEQAIEQARGFLEKALAIDPKFPAALNNLGYLMADEQKFPIALDLITRYVTLIPGEPNGEDSYAEILEHSGNFPGALDHYQRALNLDPKFTSSQQGLADVYSLMGDEARARVEYEKAAAISPSEGERLAVLLAIGATWIREGRPADAARHFGAVAAHAHRVQLDLYEARAYRYTAMCVTDPAAALQHLEEAEQSLQHTAVMGGYERQLELASILRHRVVRAIESKQNKLAEIAYSALRDLADTTGNRMIQREAAGAHGALLMAGGKYQDATSALEEDIGNPYSLRLLIRAYKAVGDKPAMENAENRLLNLNLPTLEHALVVLPARSGKS